MRDAAIDTHRSPARGAGRSRSAGAPPLDDMVGEGPVSRGAPRRGGITSAAVAAQRLGGGRSAAAAVRGPRDPGLVARLRGRLPRIRPLKALTIGAFGVALVGIVANAMVFQRGHHPAPLFGLGRSVDDTTDAAGRTAAAVPAPSLPVPVENTGTIPPVAVAPAPPAPPAVAAAPKPAPVHHAAAKLHLEEAAASKPGAVAATGHPRPGHPAPTHAKAETKPAEAKSVGAKSAEAKSAEAKPEKAEARPDPVAKLLSGGAHASKPESKPAAAAKPAAKPDAKPVAAAPAAAHPHHRLAAAAPAEAAKPAARTE